MERVWLVSYGLAWLLVAAQILTLGSLFWAFGRVHLQRAPNAQALITDEGPDIHAPMPEFVGRDTAGEPVRSDDCQGRELVLLLLSPQCAPCEQLLRDLNATRRGLFTPPEFLIVMEASRSQAETYRRRYRLQVSCR